MPRDADWVTRALHGDKYAFGMLVRRYQQRVYGLAYHILGSFEDAQDLTQEAFLMAYQKLHSLKQPEKFAPWLHSIAMNLCKMWQRAAKHPWVSLDLVIEEDQPIRVSEIELLQPDDPAKELEGKELYELAAASINALPETCRLTATLFFMNDMTYNDISDFLGIPVSTVQSRVQRSRKLLREMMMDMVQEWFDVHKLPDDFYKKVLAETDTIRIGQMTIGEPLWGRNVLSAKLTNKTTRTQWIGMDIRSEVKEERGSNWQRQFLYEVPTQGVKTIRESFDINRILRDFDYYRGKGRCTLRISFASVPEDMLDPMERYAYVLKHPFFSKTYPLRIIADVAAAKKVEPILPAKGSVALSDIEIPQPRLGENQFLCTLTNHTGKTQYVHIHIDAIGGDYGGGESYELAPNESRRIEQRYLIYHEEEELTISVYAIVMPENLPELEWGESVIVWSHYALDYPDAIIHRGITRFSILLKTS